MIISKLQGGLANQLFQWSIAKNLSIKFNIPFYLDVSFYDNQVGVTHRNFSLLKFPNIKIDKKINISNKPIITLNDNFNYQNLILSKEYSYFLNGFWQSEKYFKEIRDIILKEILPDKITKNKLEKIIKPKNNSTSIHVRRTDYVSSNGFHPTQSLEYYSNAILKIGEYDNIYVFSDDIEWCKNNLNFERIIFVEGMDDVEDLWLMSMCKNNIIANSSFSWWGAWLNNNKDKKVIAPSLWFGQNSNLNTNDIVPKEWIQI